jgi:hypothetical protein
MIPDSAAVPRLAEADNTQRTSARARVPGSAALPHTSDSAAAGRRAYSKAEYIAMFEARRGQPLSWSEKKLLDLGCIGATMVRLGRTGIDPPPLHLAFADPRAHRAVSEVEKILGPGEVNTAAVNSLARELRSYRTALKTADPAASDKIRNKITDLEEVFARAKEITRSYWSDAMKSYDITDLQNRREAAKFEGNRLAFERASGIAGKFNEILAGKPADATEFERIARQDEQLAGLRGIAESLPSGDLTDVHATVFSKHFWSGQIDTLDATGQVVRDIFGNPQGRAGDLPDPDRFAPNADTGQVDMSRDLYKGKPGFIKFDYGWYDEKNGCWWNANHAEHSDADRRAADPMRFYRCSPEVFLAGLDDFDSSVMCVAFTRTTLS